MNFRYLYLACILLLFIQSCKKDTEPPSNTVKELSDFGVKYSAYESGFKYVSDTFQTKFKVTNFGPATFEKGDTVFAAVEINDVVYGLDLIGSGPTAILLSKNLGVNENFEYNPGYLLKSPTLDYYGLDTLDITILLYGQSGSPTDGTFSKDPTPANNKTVLRLTRNDLFIVD